MIGKWIYTPQNHFLDNKLKKCVGKYRGSKYKSKCCCYRIKKKEESFQGRGWIKGIQIPSLYRRKNEKENKILSLIIILDIPGIRGAPMITLQAPDYHTQGSWTEQCWQHLFYNLYLNIHFAFKILRRIYRTDFK